MLVYAIDDEEDALELLELTIREAVPGVEVCAFDDPVSAIECFEEDDPKVVFTDIQMPDMLGVELAKRLKTINPEINIVFVTGYSEFTSQAIRLHASGYVMKPVTVSAIKNEMKNLLFPVEDRSEGIFAKTFGAFEFLINGEAVHFKRKKSKEMLALLIDKEGLALSNETIASYLFMDQEYGEAVQNKMSSIIADLMKSLKEAGAEKLVIKNRGSLQVDKSMFECDAYDYWDGKAYAINQFKGEYMTGYEWAEDSKEKFYWK